MTTATVEPVAKGQEREWLGWKAPDPLDMRDDPYRFMTKLRAEMVPIAALPPRAAPQRKELDRHPTMDQGPTGSCVGHGVGLCAAVERNVTARSPFFIYYEARRIINETGIDDGAYIRDGVKVAAELGSPTYSKWPSKLENLFIDPAEKADRDAAKRKVFSYHRLRTGHEMRSCLAGGHLFTFGFMCYPNIDDPLVERFGILARPTGGAPQGGHCVAAIGYDDDFANSAHAKFARDRGFPGSMVPAKAFECQNSWGANWGNGGRFWIDADYVEHYSLASDFWTLRGFENPNR